MKNPVPKPGRLALPAALLCCLPAAVQAAPVVSSNPPTTASAAVAVPVTGQVLDEKGQGLPGVTVLEKGTSNGATTNVDGRYTLNVASGSATLVFSFVGYATQEVDRKSVV